MRVSRDLLWNYIGYGISFGVNILLLPIVLNYLDEKELGLWYVFLSVGTFVTMVDFGFSPQISRFVTYAYAGTDVLKSNGVSSSNSYDGPNVPLIYGLLRASHKLFLWLAIVVLFLLLFVGTPYVYTISKALFTTDVAISWMFFCVASFINILYCYYSAFYRGIGDFVSINQALLFSKSMQIICSFIGLYYNGGLVAIALAFLLSGITFRTFLYFRFRLFKLKYFTSQHEAVSDLSVLKIIWHNSWKEGLVMLSRYLIIQSNTILCSLYIGLTTTASYALAVQLLTIISSISLIHFTTKLPELNATRVNNQIARRKTLLSSLWISFVCSYFVLLLLLYVVGIPVIEYIKPHVMLDNQLLLFVAVYMFLESNQSFFASYISTSNQLPYVFPYLISALGGVLLSFLLLEYTNLGVWGIILAHFSIQLLYNNWKWMYYVQRESQLTIGDLFVNGMKYYLNYK